MRKNWVSDPPGNPKYTHLTHPGKNSGDALVTYALITYIHGHVIRGLFKVKGRCANPSMTQQQPCLLQLPVTSLQPLPAVVGEHPPPFPPTPDYLHDVRQVHIRNVGGRFGVLCEG